MGCNDGPAPHAGLASSGASPAAKKPPLTLEEAQRHGRLCTIRQVQKPLEELCQDAKLRGLTVEEELCSRGMRSTDDFFEQCSPFPLKCSPMDFSELGSGFPLYFQFLQFLILMTVLFLFIQIPVIVEHARHNRMHEWNWHLTARERRTCETCVSNNGNDGLYGVRIDGYGESCREHDMAHCSAFVQNSSAPELGVWCCQRWCYVSEKCPVAKGSTAMPGLFYSYDACADDPDTVRACQWKKNLEFTAPQLSNVESALIPQFLPYMGIITPGNAGPKGIATERVIWVQFAISMVFLAALTVQKARLLRTETLVDNRTTQPNDFAILVRGLPQTATDEATIADFFRKNAVKGREVEVVKVVICWDLKEFNDLNAQMKKEKQTLRRLVTQGFGEDHPQVQGVKSNLNRLRALLLSAGPEAASRISSTGIAIVVLRQQEDHRRCLERWTGFWPRLSYCEPRSVHGLQLQGDPLPCFPNASGVGIWRLTVARAANPSDINWEDLGRTWQERLKGLVLNGLSMLLIVAVAAVIVWALQLWQETLKSEISNKTSGRIEVSAESGLSVIPAVLVSVVNMGLVMSSKKLSEREFHLTKTSEAASTTLKMTTALVMNTALVLLILNNKTKDWYLRGGLIDDLFWMLLINVFVPPISQAVDLPAKMKRLFRCVRNLDKKITEVPRARGELMLKFWEPSAFNSSRRYSTVLTTFITCSIFQPLMPQALLFSLVGITLQYFIDKYMLLRVLKRPSILEGPTQAKVSLDAARFFVSIGLPITTFFFLKPSIENQSRLVFPLVLELAIAVFMAALPDSVQRMLLCTCVCLRRSRFSICDGASEIDYYSAQHFWPASMKYHMAHPLYQQLPENINPEIMSPSTAALSTSDIRGNYTQATQAMASDKPSVKAVTPILIGYGAYKPSDVPVRRRGSEQRTQVFHIAPQEMKPEPALVPDAGHIKVEVPVWEFEARGGWQRFGDDCQGFLEARYQDFKQGNGGPTRKVQTRGIELTVNFKEMTQAVDGSHKVRKMRRQT